MPKINILTPDIFNRIAAGEVVDRPYSVVKELVENALDAGATEIEVQIENGGKTYISVRDNGEGVEYADLKSLFLPHATSKIQKASDLENINTLGFRGEAVASISAVSRMSYTSKRAGAPCYKISCNGGEIGLAQQTAGEEVGTFVEVSDLFYNTPVRMKFLKSDKAEEGDITTFIHRFMLSNPKVTFRYFVDKKPVLKSFGGGEEEVLASVYGASILNNTFHIDGVKNGIRVRGFVSDRNFFKPNRSHQSIFLNGRYIVNATISAALTSAYASYVMKRQYPFYVLHITVPNEVVDVNVHPNKADVRFADNQVVFSAVYGIVSAVLDGSVKGTEYLVGSPMPTMPKNSVEPPKTVALPEQKDDGMIKLSEKFPAFFKTEEKAEKPQEKPQKVVFPEVEKAKQDVEEHDFEKVRQEIRLEEFRSWKQEETTKKQKRYAPFEEYKDLFFKENTMGAGSKKEEKDDAFEENKKYLAELDKKAEQTKIDVDAVTYKGNLFNTFLLYELGDKVYIIDQHAAHERLIFNRLKEKMENRQVLKQPMLLPYKIHLSPSEDVFLFDCLPSLREIGFEIDESGMNRFEITAVPLDLQNISLDEFFAQFLRDLSGLRQIKLEEILKDRLAMMACKAAIKGGMTLTNEEVMQLIKDMNGDITLKCPHGRPAVVVMSKYEIEKLFKRIV